MLTELCFFAHNKVRRKLMDDTESTREEEKEKRKKNEKWEIRELLTSAVDWIEGITVFQD